MSWSAEIMNDPRRGYELYVELMHNDEYVARIQRNSSGELELATYGGAPIAIPFDWLRGLVSRFEDEVPAIGG